MNNYGAGFGKNLESACKAHAWREEQRKEREQAEEREVWFVVVELHEAPFTGETVQRTAYSDIGSAQMMCDQYDHNPAAWPGVRRAWVECGTQRVNN